MNCAPEHRSEPAMHLRPFAWIAPLAHVNATCRREQFYGPSIWVETGILPFLSDIEQTPRMTRCCHSLWLPRRCLTLLPLGE